MNPTVPRRDLFDQAVRILEQMGFPARLHELYAGPFMHGNAMAAIEPPAQSATVDAAVALAAREAKPDAEPEAIAKVLPTRIDAVKTGGIHYQPTNARRRDRVAAGSGRTTPDPCGALSDLGERDDGG